MGLLDFFRKKKPSKEIASLQNFVDSITLDLQDWWGLPRTSGPRVKIADKDVGIASSTDRGLFGLGHDNISITRKYLDGKYKDDLKRLVAKQVFMFLQDNIRGKGGNDYRAWYSKEFFTTINILHISEEYPDLFRYEYGKYIGQAIDFSKKKKEYKNAIRSAKNIGYYKTREQENLRLQIERNQLTRYPATAYYFEIKNMTPHERYNILSMGSIQLTKKIIEGHALEKMEDINKLKEERAEIKKVNDLNKKEFTDSAAFFAGTAVASGFKEWGREFPAGLGEVIRKDKYVPLESLINNKKGFLFGGNKPSFSLFGKKQRTVTEILESIKPDGIRLAKQNALQDLSEKLTPQIIEFWGIPYEIPPPEVVIVNKDEIKENDIDLSSAVMWGFGNGRTVIFVSEDYLSEEFGDEGVLGSIKSVLSEEVLHSLHFCVDRKIGKNHDSYSSEFFALVSRLFISEQVGEKIFAQEYVYNLLQSLVFKYDRKNAEKSIFDSIAKDKNLSSNIKSAKEHFSYFPAYALYMEIRNNMSSSDRFDLLKMDNNDLRKFIENKASEKMEELIKEVGIDANELKVALPSSKAFTGESVGYGRMSEFEKSETQKQIQSLVYGFSAIMADFWGIPRKRVQKDVPIVIIFNEYTHPRARNVKAMAYMYDINSIYVNENFLANYKKDNLIMSLESLVAEEVGHFLHYLVDKDLGVAYNERVSEFFAMMSRMCIAERMGPEKFSKEYGMMLNNAIRFTQEIDDLEKGAGIKVADTDKLLGEFWQKMKHIEDLEAEDDKKMRAVQVGNTIDLDHLFYYNSYTYYFEIKKLNPQQRLDLLRLSYNEIIDSIIFSQFDKLQTMGWKRVGRKYLRGENIKDLANHSNTAQFFENLDNHALDEAVKEDQKISDEEEKAIKKVEKEEEEIESKDEREIEEAESEMVKEDKEFEKDDEQSVNNDIKEDGKQSQEQYKRFDEEDTRDVSNELSK
jgi:hypothetical protein